VLTLRGRAVVGTALVLVLAVAGYAIYHSFGNVTPALPPPGCQAGTGEQAITLDTDQAANAATIAGVAARHRLPRQAVTIALATALQESKLEDLDYGDLDSVGIFQQRPSQGWGPAADLEDPVYATTKFFAALIQVPGYTKLPLYQAAQDVQHSADGSAYEQWAWVAGQLSGYLTGQPPHGVSCWYAPAGPGNLAGAVRQMTHTFGPPGRKAVVIRITTDRSAQKNNGSAAVLHVQRTAAWTVASWLVAHAQAYGLSEVRYAGYEWKAANGTMGWQPDPGPNASPRGSIVAG
jgi:hypothetical protein